MMNSNKYDFSKYESGSLISVSLQDFMTYENCVVTFSPYMNMIIGPNGCGKSSIMCSILLCLGGSPGIVGRSKDLNSFIRKSSNEANIQVVLRSKYAVKKYHIIQRKIIRKGSTEYKIDGVKKTHSEVLALVRNHSIYLDNLCQVLPQERVSEFAHLSPQKYLIETQKAILPDLYEKHKEIIELDDFQKSIIIKKIKLDDSLAIKQQEISRNQPQVDRFHQYQRSVQKLHHLELQRPRILYKEKERAMNEIKKQKEKSLKSIEEKKKNLKGILNELSTIENEEKSYIKEVTEVRSNRKEIEDSLIDSTSEIKGYLKRSEKKKEEILEKRRKKENIEIELLRLNGEIKSLKALCKKKVEPPMDIYETEYSKARRNKNEVTGKISEIEEKQKRLERTGNEKSRLVENLTKKLESQDVEKTRRIGNIERYDSNTAEIYKWLSNNRQKFKKGVYGPVCMEIGLKDQGYVEIIETILGRTILMTFFCLCEEDYQLFLREIADKMKFRVNLILYKDYKEPRKNTELTNEMIKEYGFDSFAGDVLTGPPELINSICGYTKIDLVPIAKKQLSKTMIKSIEKNPLIKRFAIGTTMYEIKKGSWGVAGTRTTEASRAQFLGVTKNQSEIENRIAEAKKDASLNHKEYTALLEQRSILIKEQNEADSIYEEVDLKRKDLLNLHSDFNRNARKLDTKKQRYQNLKIDFESMSDDGSLIEEYRRILKDASKQASVLIQSDLKEFMKKTNPIREKEIRSVERIKDKSRIEKDKTTYEKIIQGEKDRYDVLLRDEDDCRYSLFELKDSIQKLNINEETERALSTLPTTIAEIDSEISRESIKKTNLGDSDLALLRRYEEKIKEAGMTKKEIEELNLKIKEQQEKLDSRVKEWEPPLEDAIKNISTKFSRIFEDIGFVGQVVLEKNKEAFSNWGIEIKVKFRNAEKLHSLNINRQSGGERSLTTITYLLAMHEMFKLPFRMVDEINQGMDPYNERKVHNILDRLAEESPSQFILVTPKLLPDLKHNKNTTVICICHGICYKSKKSKKIKQTTLDGMVQKGFFKQGQLSK
eukprot:GHVP01035424.1.p1 GENE.GHVP01035424.1~~GHVP01035424.1.p1  ORF type:complete len:1054 (+),score=253.10 GHVP01035424.1:263-3424(+)